MAFQNIVRDLTEVFARRVLEAIRTAPLEELVSSADRAGGRGSSTRSTRGVPAAAKTTTAPKARRGGKQRGAANGVAAALQARIVDALTGVVAGLRAEVLRSTLGVSREELARPLADALSKGAIRKQGAKRGTTYFLGGAEASSSSAAPKGNASKGTRRPAPRKPAVAAKRAKKPEASAAKPKKKKREAFVYLTDAGKAAERGVATRSTSESSAK